MRVFQPIADPYRSLSGVCALLGTQYVSTMLVPRPPSTVHFVVTEPDLGGNGAQYPELFEIDNDMANAIPPARRYGPLSGHALTVTPYPDVRDRLQALPSLVLPCDGDDVSVLLTPQLSGCTLVYLPSTAARREVRIIHIRPIGLRDGHELQDILLAAQAQFAGAPGAVRLYGRNDCGTTNVNILGLRQGNRWSLVLQRFVQHGTALGAELLPLYDP